MRYIIIAILSAIATAVWIARGLFRSERFREGLSNWISDLVTTLLYDDKPNKTFSDYLEASSLYHQYRYGTPNQGENR